MGSRRSPVFPMPHQPDLAHHFSDYGFDPQIDYFQLMQEARKHKRDATTTTTTTTTKTRPIDNIIHFKLRKPISNHESNSKTTTTSEKKRRRWWKKALHLLKRNWILHRHNRRDKEEEEEVHRARARDLLRASMSGPVSITPPKYQTCNPVSVGELNMEQHKKRMSTSALPTCLLPF